MKRKLQLSELKVESFVTSSKKNEFMLPVLGAGALSTNTDNHVVCINYSYLNTCNVNTIQKTCIYSNNPDFCVDSFTQCPPIGTLIRAIC